jgi:LmbE family N-acetylglucosaminyl deacetylase
MKLDGQKLDLEEFPRWFPRGDVYGIEEKGEYYLTGPAFETAGNAEAVLKGNKGSGNRSVTSEQLAPIRAEEQRRAAQVLGVGYVEFLGYEDGELEDTRDLRRDVTREIRRWRPNLIITLNSHRTYNNFPGWHRDHRVTGRVVLDCVYPLARDHLAFPELPREYEPHSVREVHFIQWEQPRLLIDISETMELKLEAIRATRARSVTLRISRLACGIAQRCLGKRRDMPMRRGLTRSWCRADG